MSNCESFKLSTLSKKMAPDSSCLNDLHNNPKFVKVSSVSSIDSIHANAQVDNFLV